ncbi:hypothetical protein NBRC111894_791 [Sporolactobacillus inulinus]|uniref:Uncharacterized protein n=1 Tax=Sporolactobacillus inulinus TaxID=2078 RepID=A0A4Y1Z864_9BACL|nr:hypothetical protein [Sporolactobacillus inulinus]GAY75237.1 hypothetical protein NBRC111894_791 [Sporolactobacillus inulinus]
MHKKKQLSDNGKQCEEAVEKNSEKERMIKSEPFNRRFMFKGIQMKRVHSSLVS